MFHTAQLTFMLLLLLLLTPWAAAQHSPGARPAEANAEVLSLHEFHGVIYTIWHEAWPAKDAAALRKLLPRVESGAEAITRATLPGILREKKEAWNTEVGKLTAIVTVYAAAAKGDDDAALLSAAEQLHTQYERLVRVIRPVLKEVDEFHAVMYMLYHYYLPGDSLEQIRVSTAALKKAMTSMNAAVLPERLKGKTNAFDAARKKLTASVEAAHAAAVGGKMPEISKAVKTAHLDYQALEKVFE